MIYALTVGRNEEHRYLRSMLRNVREWADMHFFYDDRSTDETYHIAYRAHALAWRRDPELTSFEEDEGLFRAQAWQAFEWVCNPKEGDWVLVIDCDEMLVGNGCHVREALDEAIRSTQQRSIDLVIPEVFGFDEDGCPLVRVDRLWGTIHAPRLFQYRPGGVFASGKVGVPAVPSYVMAQPWGQTDLISLMHFGYANPADVKSKYERYAGVPGHSGAHVASIIESPSLVRWEQPINGRMHHHGDG